MDSSSSKSSSLCFPADFAQISTDAAARSYIDRALARSVLTPFPRMWKSPRQIRPFGSPSTMPLSYHSFVIASDAGDGIKHFGDRAGEDTALACIESLAPLPITFRKIRNGTGLSLKCGDAPRNGRLGKWQMVNLCLSITVEYSRNGDVNDRAILGVILYSKNRESGIALICRWRECPNLSGVKLGCGWSRLLGTTANDQ